MQLNFDATEVAPSQPYDPLPPGKYAAMVIESEIKPTSKGDGRYLELVWEVTDGDFKGRRLWSRLNLENPNQTAMEIAYRELSAICHAVGKLKIQASEELHHVPALLTVKLRQDAGRDPTNEVKGYQALGQGLAGTAPTAPGGAPWQKPAGAPGPAPAAPATGARPAKRPWERAA